MRVLTPFALLALLAAPCCAFFHGAAVGGGLALWSPAARLAGRWGVDSSVTRTQGSIPAISMEERGGRVGRGGKGRDRRGAKSGPPPKGLSQDAQEALRKLNLRLALRKTEVQSVFRDALESYEPETEQGEGEPRKISDVRTGYTSDAVSSARGGTNGGAGRGGHRGLWGVSKTSTSGVPLTAKKLTSVLKDCREVGELAWILQEQGGGLNAMHVSDAWVSLARLGTGRVPSGGGEVHPETINPEP